jgi:hypothetical protein
MGGKRKVQEAEAPEEQQLRAEDLGEADANAL